MKPLTFSQRWKVATVALIAGAGMVATAILGWLVWIVWKGTWSVAVEALRIDVMGKIAVGMIVLMAMTMMGLLVAGPLSRISGKLGQAEMSAEGD